MTSISGLSGGMAAYYAQLTQTLFNRIDSNGDGAITQSELETAVTAAGGTTSAADALYTDLDPTGTGTVSESQFANGVQSLLGPEMGAQLIAVQEASQGGNSVGGGFANQLFSEIDANGDGTITQSELEQAVTQNGGTTASADALWSELDPSGAGSITEQQFAANLPQPGNGTSATDSSDGAQAAMASLAQGIAPPPGAPWHDRSQSGTTGNERFAGFANQLFSEIDANGDGTITQSELEQAVTESGGTTASADALWSQLDPSGGGSISEQQFASNLPQPGNASAVENSGGSSAQAAIAALAQNLAPPLPTGNPSEGGSLAAPTSSSTASGGGIAFSAVQDLIENAASSSASGGASGNSAQDALLALLGQNAGGTGASTSGMGLASVNLNYQTIMQWLQPQSSGSVLV